MANLLRLILISIVFSGCSSVVSSEVRSEREVLRTYTESVETDGGVEVTQATWKNLVFRSKVQREVLCSDVDWQEIRTTKTQVNETEKVWADLALGAVLTGAGAGMLIASQNASQMVDPNDPEDISTKDSLTALGWTSGFFGIGWMGMGGLTAIRGIDQKVGVKDGTEEVSATEPSRCSSKDDLLNLTFVHDGKTIKAYQSTNGRVELDLGKKLSLCSVDGLGTPMILEDGRGEPIHSQSIDDCVLANRITIALRDVDSELQEARPDFGKCASILAKSDTDLMIMDPEVELVQRLRIQLKGARTSANERAKDVSKELLREFKETLASDGISQTTLVAGRNAIGASIFSNILPEATFRAVYGALIQHPDLRADEFEALVVDDLEIFNCVKHQKCPEWWKDDTWDTITHARFEALEKQHRGSTARLKKAAASLKKKTTLKRSQKVEEEQALGRIIQQTWCTSALLNEGMIQACREFSDADQEAETVLREAKDKLLDLRIRATAKAWKGQFRTCRKVAKGIKSFSGISARSCTGACRSALTKLIADNESLKSFYVEDATWDEPTLQSVRKQCVKAKCPKCP